MFIPFSLIQFRRRRLLGAIALLAIIAAPLAPRAAFAGGGARELIVLQPSLADFEQLVANLTASRPGAAFEILTLDSHQDGIAQITARLTQSDARFGAVHLLSHGSAGKLTLGSTVLEAGSLGQKAEALRQWQSALTAEADVLIYSCDVAAGEAGRQLVRQFAALSGADVAASTNKTGFAAWGGDWALEYQVGAITHAGSATAWGHLLPGTPINGGTGAFAAGRTNSLYSVNFDTGKATLMFTDPAFATPGINGIGYDDATGIYYYASNESANSNRAIYGWNSRTGGGRFTVAADVTTFGVTLGTSGVGSGAGDFSGGMYWFGTENSSGSDDQVWRMTLNAAGTAATGITLVGAISGGNDFGDILVNAASNLLYDFDGANDVVREYSITPYALVATDSFAGVVDVTQAARDRNGVLYFTGTSLQTYNPAGAGSAGSARTITTNGTTGLGSLNDASGWIAAEASIGNRVFYDTNSNGLDDGEDGIEGLTVQLFDDLDGDGAVDAGETLLATTTTSATGAYLFNQLLPGDYIVRITDPTNILNGGTSTTGGLTQTEAVRLVGAQYLDNDFGFQDNRPFLAVNDVAVTEGTDAFAIFNVQLSRTFTAPITFSLALTDGTAVAADYGPGLEVSTNGGTNWTPAATATFAAGTTSVLVRTPIVNDVLDENAEAFTVTATRTAGEAQNTTVTGTATITDNDPTPAFTINDVTRNEDAGTADFTVTLSGASSATVTVNYATSNGAASAGADYTATSGTLTFPVGGAPTQTISVPILDDAVFEDSETFTVTLSGATNGIIADGTGLGTILDDGTGVGGADDDRPSLSVNDVATTEGTDLFAVFTVSLSNPSAFATTVSLALANGTAVAADYGPALEVSTDGGGTFTAGTSATFTPGTTSVLVRTPITNDALDENVENFTLTATRTAGTTTNANATGTATITDEDAAPVLTINDVTRNEDTGTMTFTATLSATSGLPITVDYATASGTATSGADFTATSGTLTFAAGVPTQTISVSITDDTVFENSETFNVLLSNATNATIADGTGVGTILDNGTGAGGTDDDRPSLNVSNVTTTEGTDPFAVFTVSLSNGSTIPTTVSLALANGTAIAADYGPGLEVSTNGGTTWTPSATATFAPSATSVLVRTPITDDATDENSEAFTLTATVTAGTTVNPSATGTGTIVDNDDTGLSINDVTRNEATGTMSFNVTLNAPSAQPVTVGYATTSGTATSGADFTATSGTLTFAPGVVSQPITVPITNDAIFENSEAFNVVLSGATNAAIADGTGIGTILDDGTGAGGTDDDRPSLSVINVATTEGTDPFAVFTVALSNPSAFATTVSLALADGTALGADYGPALEVSTNGGTTFTAATNATFAPGATSVLVRTPITNDTLDENVEDFTLTATVTAGTTTNASDTGTATITDNDATPTLTINDVTRNEDTGTMTFTATLSAASGLPISVDYATASGTATSGADFTATSGTLTFAAGATTQTITVPITDDATFENSETFTVVLSSPSNATITDGNGVGTILDDGTGAGGIDDDRPALSINNLATTEGTDPFAVFTVALSNPSAFVTTVSLALANGTAVAADYGPGLEISTNDGTTWTAGSSATFAPGATSVLVRTPITDDVIDENTEDFTLTATRTAGTTTNASVTGTATITDDDGAAALSIDDVTRNEAAGTATFTVTLSAPSAMAITVNYATASGTATSGADFSATSGTLTFAAGELSQAITVPILNDATFENSETFTVALSIPANATIADGTGVGTILDEGTGPGGTDNDAPVLAVSNVATTEGNDPFAVFAVTLSNPSSFATTVSLALANGTAVAADYGPGLEVSTNGGVTWTPSATATFAPGATSVLVRTAVVNDAISETTEDFTLTAMVTAGTTANPNATGTATIADNDVAALAINDVTVSEEAGTATFTVTLSGPSGLPITVNFATASGTATSGADFSPTSGTLTFAPGVVSQTINVPILNDAVFENSETFNVVLSNATNTTIADSTGIGTILDDRVIDNGPPIAQNDAATTPEDTAVTLPVLTNDSDPDSDTLTVTTATVPAAQGIVAINPDNTLRFTPAPNFTGAAMINYTIADGNGGTASAIATVTITSVNDAPVATNDSATTPAERPITIDILANDSDPENNPLTVTTATLVDGRGTVVINPDGTIEFTPAPGFTGSASVVYTISDGQGGTATATVTIRVDALPIATDDFASTTPGVAKLIPVLVNDIDPEGLPLTVIDATILPSQGTFTITPQNELLFTPAAGVVGTVAGTYTIRDEAGNIATANVTITISQTPAPQPPVAVSDSASTVQQTPVTIPVLQNDSDPAGGTLTVIAATVPASEGTVVINPNGTLTFTAAAGFEGTATVSYTIQNPAGATASAPAVIQVAGGNAPPNARPDSATAASGVPKVVRLLVNDTDPDGDPLTVVSATVPPAQGTVQVNPDNTVTFTSAAGFTGTAVISYRISDGNGGTSNSTVSIAVSAAPVNAPPDATNDTAATPVDQPIDIPVLANDSDPDGDLLTVTSVSVPAGQGTATINPDGTVHYVPAPGLNDDVILTYTISDGQGGTDTAIVTINVNDNPVAVADRVSTPPATPVTVSVLTNDTDPNNNPLTLTAATSDPAEGTLVLNGDGTLTFTPAAGFTGIAEVSYTITDGKGGFAEGTVYITVNSPPVAVNDTGSTPLDQPVIVAVLANDTDPDGDPLTVVGATVDPVQGTVVINPDNTLTFTPAATFTSPAVITYTITDPSGARATATVTITRGNLPPTAEGRTVYTYCATPLRVNPFRTATDPDGDTLTIVSVTQPQFGKAIIKPNGTVLYRPNVWIRRTMVDSFIITLSDGRGGTTTETITVRSFGAIAGTFQGLLGDTAPPPAAAIPAGARGRLTVTLTNRAAFTARLQLDGAVFPIAGTLEGALTYQRKLLIDGEKATLTLTYHDLTHEWSMTLVGPGISVEDVDGITRRATAPRTPAVHRVALAPRTSTESAGTAIVRQGSRGTMSVVGVLPNGAPFSSGARRDGNGSAAIYDWISDTVGSVAGNVKRPAGAAATPIGTLRWSAGDEENVPLTILDLAEMP